MIVATLSQLPPDVAGWVREYGDVTPCGFVGHREDFRPELRVAPSGRSMVQTQAPLHWFERAAGVDLWWLVTVPADTVSDGASIPRLLHVWPGNPLEGTFLRAAMIHDWLYRVQTVTRGTADAVFRRGLLADDTSGAKAAAMYAGVRVGGWRPWRRYAEALRA